MLPIPIMYLSPIAIIWALDLNKFVLAYPWTAEHLKGQVSLGKIIIIFESEKEIGVPTSFTLAVKSVNSRSIIEEIYKKLG